MEVNFFLLPTALESVLGRRETPRAGGDRLSGGEKISESEEEA